MNSIIFFILGFLVGLFFCLFLIYWRTRVNPFRLGKIQSNAETPKNSANKMKHTQQHLVQKDDFLDKAIEMIQSNLGDEDFRVAALAEELFMSRSQLFRRIKDCTGMSPSALLKKQRLEQAYQLLSQTNLNVSEVATQSGFKDLGHFSRSFRQQYGYPPKRFKQRQTDTVLQLSFAQ
jgi:transcriptional regulator GlxA family with amidase domain